MPSESVLRLRGHPFILQLRVGVNLVILERHLSCAFFDADADELFAFRSGPSIANNIITEHQVLGLTTNPDAGGLVFPAVVLNNILLQSIAVPSHSDSFIAEKDAVLAVAADLIFLQ